MVKAQSFRSTFILFSLASLALLANCNSDDEEKKIAEKITDNICSDDSRSKSWFDCVSCCQGMNPYKLKKKTECNLEARNKEYKVKDLNAKTKGKMCNGMQKYGEALKKVVMDLKGDLKPCCGDKDGMQDLFDKKLTCFENCWSGDGGLKKNKDAKYC